MRRIVITSVICWLLTASSFAFLETNRFNRLDQSAPSFVSQCKLDTDCEVQRGPCNNPYAVNKKLIHFFTSWSNYQKRFYGCFKNSQSVRRSINTLCLHEECKLLFK